MRAYVIKTEQGYATADSLKGTLRGAITSYLFTSKRQAKLVCTKDEEIIELKIKIKIVN